MADPRYLEAWKRNPVLSSAQKKKDATAAPTTSLQVRLDTPGGVTYSPSELSSHNVIKRLFIPYQVGDGNDERNDNEEYNFEQDLKQEEESKSHTQAQDLEQEDGAISAARAYALSIDFDALAEKRERALEHDKQYTRIDEEGNEGDMDSYGMDKMSISGQSKMSVSSQMTTATLATLGSSKKDGSLPDWFTRTSAHKDVVPFIVPASQTGKYQDSKRPWDAMRWHGHRAFERPSERERERGIAAFDDVNGIGRAPSIAEARQGGDFDDSRSILTMQTSNTLRQTTRSLNVADLFVVDPRKSHTLRMVRRTDPRQVLLVCNGVYLGAAQVATSIAAQAAQKAGVSLKDLTSNNKDAQKMLSAAMASARPRGGIGVLYCPHEEPLNQNEEVVRAVDQRIDINCAKRLEAPPEFSDSTERRAQLRAVLAAIELANWEEEGFDKIVIGVEQNWIVRGISNDVWRWKHNDWITATGEKVADRDLWELVDAAVQEYEKIDCNVRFWHISSKDARLARNLAEIGAMKDFQRPTLVRWRRKRPLVLPDPQKKKKNHQGPTLSSR